MQAGLRWTLMIFLPANWILGSGLGVRTAAVAVGRNSVFLASAHSGVESVNKTQACKQEQKLTTITENFLCHASHHL